MTDPAANTDGAHEPPRPRVRLWRRWTTIVSLDVASTPARFVLAIWRGPISRNLGGAVGTQLFVLISGTIAARLLGPLNRGYLAILTSWASAIGQVGGVGMSLAATYFLSSNQIGGRELLAVLRRPASIQITLLTLIDICVMVPYTLISGAPILLAAAISFVALPFAGFADYGFAFLLGARRHGRVNAFRSIQPALYAATLVILYLLNIRTLAVAVGCLAASVIVAGTIVALAGIRSVSGVHVDGSIVSRLGVKRARKEILAFGRRGYVGYLSPVDTFRLDQLVIGFLLSPQVLGFYVVGSAFNNFGRLVAFNIGLSATPEIAANANEAERWLAVRRTLALTAGLLVIINLALAGFVVLAIPLLFGEQYRSSIPVAEILLVAGSLLGIKRVAVDSMRGAGEARIGTRAEIVNVVVFLVLCAPLGLALGGIGIALALVLGTLGGSLLLVRRLHHFGVF